MPVQMFPCHPARETHDYDGLESNQLKRVVSSPDSPLSFRRIPNSTAPVAACTLLRTQGDVYLNIDMRTRQRASESVYGRSPYCQLQFQHNWLMHWFVLQVH